MTKKILSCFFAILLCALCLVGCSQQEDGVPEGMYSATKEGEPFILYVPSDWSDNCDSGISSAYVMSEDVMVSARYFALGQSTLTDFVDAAVKEYEEQYKNDDYKSIVYSSKESLSGKKAVKYQFSFNKGNEKTPLYTTITQYYAEYKGDVILLSFYCKKDRYEVYEETFAQIKTEFIIRDKKDTNSTVVDEDTPNGMKNASFDGGEYAFYVPKTWKTNMSDKLTEASCPDKAHGNKCNVTVTAYVPEFSMTLDEYIEICEDENKQIGDSYQPLSTKERHIKTVGSDGENNAKTITYTITRGDITYKISQTFLYYNDMFYSVTYTALEENFDAHLGDLEKMLKNCNFK